VVGDVGKPSAFISDSENLTILKAIALAGGANKTAAMGGTTILRRTPEGTQQIKVPLKEDHERQSQGHAHAIRRHPVRAQQHAESRGGTLAEALTQMATALTLVAIRRKLQRPLKKVVILTSG